MKYLILPFSPKIKIFIPAEGLANFFMAINISRATALLLFSLPSAGDLEQMVCEEALS